MKGTEPTVEEIRRRLQEAGAREFAVLERSLVADTRKGVRAAVETARRRIEAEQAERARLEGLYAYERSLAEERGGHVVVGLDEVGRGPLAGPLAVGAVVLPDTPRIEGLNDSKQVKPEARERMAVQVKSCAVAWTVQYVEADVIDAVGMTASLVTGVQARLGRHRGGRRASRTWCFVDGNPLHMDDREVNVVKGDCRCASIAAASIVAKADRDALMCRLAQGVSRLRVRSPQGLCQPRAHRSHQAPRPHARASRDVLHLLHAGHAVLTRRPALSCPPTAAPSRPRPVLLARRGAYRPARMPEEAKGGARRPACLRPSPHFGFLSDAAEVRHARDGGGDARLSKGSGAVAHGPLGSLPRLFHLPAFGSRRFSSAVSPGVLPGAAPF